MAYVLKVLRSLIVVLIGNILIKKTGLVASTNWLILFWWTDDYILSFF